MTQQELLSRGLAVGRIVAWLYLGAVALTWVGLGLQMLSGN